MTIVDNAPLHSEETVSSRCYEIIKNMELGSTFNSKELRDLIPGASQGGISGFLYAITKAGMTELIGKGKTENATKSYYIYKLINKNINRRIHNKMADRTGYSKKSGYHQNRKNVPLIVSDKEIVEKHFPDLKNAKPISEQLLQIASEIAELEATSDIKNVPTNVLLAEIARRIRCS